MTEQQILELVMSYGNADYQGDLGDLLVTYVRQLARISERLSQEELVELTAIGVGMYQLALKEFEAGVNAQELLETLQKKQDRAQ